MARNNRKKQTKKRGKKVANGESPLEQEFNRRLENVGSCFLQLRNKQGISRGEVVKQGQISKNTLLRLEATGRVSLFSLFCSFRIYLFDPSVDVAVWTNFVERLSASCITSETLQRYRKSNNRLLKKKVEVLLKMLLRLFKTV